VPARPGPVLVGAVNLRCRGFSPKDAVGGEEVSTRSGNWLSLEQRSELLTRATNDARIIKHAAILDMQHEQFI
jgi:hypothetical protein